MVDYTTNKPTSTFQRNRHLQYYEQTDFRNYGPADPTLFNVGLVSSVSPTLNIASKETRVVGSRKLYANRKLMHEGTVEVVYELLDTKALKYGILDTGAGSIEKALRFVESGKINNLQRYRLYNDCITETIAFALERDFTITQTFYSSNIGNWIDDAALKTALGVTGTDTVNWAADPTAEPINHLDHETTPPNTGSPFTIGADTFLYNSLNVEVNNNLIKMNPGGYSETKHIQSGNKVVTGTLNTWLVEGAVIQDYVRNFTSNSMVLKIKEAGASDITLTLSGVKFTSLSDTVDTGANELSMMDMPFTCTDIVIAN